jgi:hypothetical protein
MLNCDGRLAAGPAGLAGTRLASVAGELDDLVHGAFEYDRVPRQVG